MRILLAICAIVSACQAGVLNKPPHIVLMVADDLGWEDVGWHDENIKTPHMNSIIKEEGVELQNHYVQPQCTPSRAALMTGVYPFHQGMQHGVIYPTQQECVPLSLDLLPKAMKNIGYDTHLIGKWHLGYCDMACTPLERGFDTHFGYYQGFNGHFDHQFGLPPMLGLDYRNQTKLVTDIVGKHNTDLQLERAQEIIDNHDTDAPLFLNMMWAAPHQPFKDNAKPEWEAMYSHIEDAELRGYFGLISHLDDAIGKLVETMKAKGLHENALYIFMSDNGGEFPVGRSGPYRGAKGSLFDGGIKSASFISGPLIKNVGGKSEAMIHVTDWYPTLVALGGGSTSGLDGVDQSETIINGAESKRDEFIVNIDSEMPYTVGRRAIRSGDYKLIHGFTGEVDGYDGDMQKTFRRCHWDLAEDWEANMPGDSFRKRAADYTVSADDLKKEEECIVNSNDERRLYNIKDDPSETTNLAKEMPEKVEELLAKLDAAEETLVEIPHAMTQMKTAGLPFNFGGHWEPGWCKGVPQANDAILLHKKNKGQ